MVLFIWIPLISSGSFCWYSPLFSWVAFSWASPLPREGLSFCPQKTEPHPTRVGSRCTWTRSLLSSLITLPSSSALHALLGREREMKEFSFYAFWEYWDGVEVGLVFFPHMLHYSAFHFMAWFFFYIQILSRHQFLWLLYPPNLEGHHQALPRSVAIAAPECISRFVSLVTSDKELPLLWKALVSVSHFLEVLPHVTWWRMRSSHPSPPEGE